jgi:hypothetical protein
VIAKLGSHPLNFVGWHTPVLPDVDGDVGHALIVVVGECCCRKAPHNVRGKREQLSSPGAP